MNSLNIDFFEDAENFIKSLPPIDALKIMTQIGIMRMDYTSVNTKLLKSPIKELKVKNYRLLFFMKNNTLYFVSGFIKKTQKTPTKEIDKAIEKYNKI